MSKIHVKITKKGFQYACQNQTYQLSSSCITMRN